MGFSSVSVKSLVSLVEMVLDRGAVEVGAFATSWVVLDGRVDASLVNNEHFAFWFGVHACFSLVGLDSGFTHAYLLSLRSLIAFSLTIALTHCVER